MTTRVLIYITLTGLIIFVHDLLNVGDGLYIIAAITFGLALRCLYLARRQDRRES